MIKHNFYSFIAGICACGGGLFGKLSGIAYESVGVIGCAVCLLIMLFLNAIMWTFFTKALKLSSTSIGPTVVSSATNYLLSGVLGILIFAEKTGILWWSGTSFILIGLLLITEGNQSTRKHQS